MKRQAAGNCITLINGCSEVEVLQGINLKWKTSFNMVCKIYPCFHILVFSFKETAEIFLARCKFLNGLSIVLKRMMIWIATFLYGDKNLQLDYTYNEGQQEIVRRS